MKQASYRFLPLSDFFTLLQITQPIVNKTLPAIFGNAAKIAVKFSDTVKIASKHHDIKRIQKFQKKEVSEFFTKFTAKTMLDFRNALSTLETHFQH